MNSLTFIMKRFSKEKSIVKQFQRDTSSTAQNGNKQLAVISRCLALHFRQQTLAVTCLIRLVDLATEIRVRWAEMMEEACGQTGQLGFLGAKTTHRRIEQFSSPHARVASISHYQSQHE